MVALRSELDDEAGGRVDDDLSGRIHGSQDPTGDARGRVNTVAEGRVRTDFYIHPAKRHAVYLRNNHTCQACGLKGDPAGQNLTVEHIKSRSSGGEVQGRLDEPSNNLTTLCNDCNATKNKYTPAQFNKNLEAKGAAHRYDVAAIRKGSARKLDLAAGAKLAAEAKAYRAANGIKLPAEAETHDAASVPPTHAEVAHAAHEGSGGGGGGPGGSCHDELGQFTACRLATVRAARGLVAALRARVA